VTGDARDTRAAAGTDRRHPSLYSVPLPDQQPAEFRPVRTRDPARKQRILAAAADLFARNGFHSVSMEDIGEAVGITASAIYRHYDSKTAVLVAMFDRVIDQLLSEGQQLATDRQADPLDALTHLIDGQIGFVVDDRDVAQVYFRRSRTCPRPIGAACAASSGSTWRSGCTCSPSCAATSTTPPPARWCTARSARSSPPFSTPPGCPRTGCGSCCAARRSLS